MRRTSTDDEKARWLSKDAFEAEMRVVWECFESYYYGSLRHLTREELHAGIGRALDVCYDFPRVADILTRAPQDRLIGFRVAGRRDAERHS